MRNIILFSLPVISALIVTASFPPFDLGILAWLGLAPLLFALRRKGPLAAAGLGFMFGWFFGIGAFCWAKSVSEISLLNFIVWLVPFSLYFAVFGLLYKLISKTIGSWILVGAPALWVMMEYARSNLFFLAWPWNLLGHSQYHYLPVIQIAGITGVYGISFLIVMTNQILSQVPDLFISEGTVKYSMNTDSEHGINWTAQVLALVLAVGLTFSYGWHVLAQPESDKHLRVGLVQGNVLTRNKMSIADQAKHLKVYYRLTMDMAKENPDLIVWPDSSLPAPIVSSRLVRYTVGKLAHDTGAYVLAGGAGQEKLVPIKVGYQPYSNSEFLISPSGRIEGQYNKMRLLPFNEYLPLQDKITWPRWITTLKESYLPGEEYTLFKVSGATFGTPICWENMFSDFFRRFVKKGANFMVSTTNEGFFGPTAFPHQTLAMNIFRAVENRVAIARITPTGVSCFISPDGKIVEKIQDTNGEDLFVSGFIVRDVPLSNKTTFYTVYGDIFAYISIGVTALIILATLWEKV